MQCNALFVLYRSSPHSLHWNHSICCSLCPAVHSYSYSFSNAQTHESAKNSGGRFSYLDLMVGNPSVTNEKLISVFTWTFCFRLRLGYGWDLFHRHFIVWQPFRRCFHYERRCCCHRSSIVLTLILYSYLRTYVCVCVCIYVHDEIWRISFCYFLTFIENNFISIFVLLSFNAQCARSFSLFFLFPFTFLFFPFAFDFFVFIENF